MILSNKTLDTVIAVAHALDAIAKGGKGFKDNLAHLVKHKTEADEATLALDVSRSDLQVKTDGLIAATEENTAAERKSEVSSARAEKVRAEATDAKNESKGLLAESKKAQTDAEDILRELADKRESFKAYYEDKSNELKKREAAVKAQEEHLEEVMAVMKR